jgi:hypothetical protein
MSLDSLSEQLAVGSGTCQQLTVHAARVPMLWHTPFTTSTQLVLLCIRKW